MNRLTGDGMPFGWTINPFRGCEVGCSYCYARSTHEFLGHSEPAEFEERIYVKSADLRALEAELCRARDSGREIAIGTATDPYQPAEQRFGVTRRVLETMARVPGLRVGITTKSALVTRDVPLLADLARTSDLWVNMSLISLDADLLRLIEPRAPRPDLRLGAVRAVTRAGVRARIFVMPVLPLITDGAGGLLELLRSARAAGAHEAISQALFLRTPPVHAHFFEWLEREFPWAVARYRALFPRPGSAPAEIRAEIDRLVATQALRAGFAARNREARIRDEAPPRPRQLSLVW